MSYPFSLNAQFHRLEHHANVSRQPKGFNLMTANLLLNSLVVLLNTYCVSWIEKFKDEYG